MNEEIRFLYDEKKVLLSSQVLEKIKYLTREDDIYSKDKSPLTNEMDSREFYERVENIIRRSKIIIKYLPSKDNEINYNTDFIDSLVEEYNKIYPEEKRGINYVTDEKLYDLINVIYQINIEEKKFYLMRNLIDAKEDCIENMKYFLDNDTILKFNEEYEKSIQRKDVKKMSDMLNYVQQAVLKEWESYFTNLENMNDDNFSFIGHSTSSTKFDKEFYSNYVSASLFNQDLVDTYRLGYGFIFTPKNIVGANTKDMYVNNYVDDEDMLLNYSVIKKINHPQRLIDECLKMKQENIEHNKDEKVYSEVIIYGFEPIGIFCFTDGSKRLNHNYESAVKLQENFPHLKIYSFDVMKRKKGADLDKMKLSLLNNLQKKFTNHTYDIDINMLTRYDYFFEEYEKLKQKGEYKEEEIELIFKENDSMLSVLNNAPDDLFNGTYSENKIKYILGKNVTYNIDYILSGKAKAFVLNNLIKLYPYKDKLNSMYDGLSEFLELLSKMEITDEMMVEINSKETINFYTISKVLSSKMISSINSKEEQSKQELNDYQEKYDETQKELHERIKLQEQYDYYYQIYINRFSSDFIKKDYDELISDITLNEQKESKLQKELSEIIEDLDEIDKKIEHLEISLYDDNLEHINYQKMISEIKTRLFELSNHPFINRKKIKEEKKKLRLFETKDEACKIEYETHKSEDINSLKYKSDELHLKKESVELKLSLSQADKNKLNDQLNTFKTKIKEYYKCDDIDEIDLAISKAEEFINKYDNANQYYITQLSMQLEELETKIINKQKNLDAIEEEKTNITRKVSG